MILCAAHAMGTTSTTAVRASIPSAELGVDDCLMVEADDDRDEEGDSSL